MSEPQLIVKNKVENNKSAESFITKRKPSDTDNQYERSLFKKLMKNKLAMLSAIYLIILALCAVFAPWITTYDPIKGSLTERMLPIGSPGHILGTDEQGRDMLTRIIYGSRLSLAAALIPVFIATTIGTVLGVVSGYYGGKIETLIMRILDVFYAFPSFLLAIAIAATIGSGMSTVFLSLSIVFIPPIARVAMSATKKVAHMEYIDAAKTSGANSFSIIYHQILRNIFSPIFTYTSTLLGLSLLLASSLSFLGLGVSPPAPEWGFMLNSLKDVIFVSPMIVFVPGFVIFITSLAFNILSDGINDAMQEK